MWCSTSLQHVVHHVYINMCTTSLHVKTAPQYVDVNILQYILYNILHHIFTKILLHIFTTCAPVCRCTRYCTTYLHVHTAPHLYSTAGVYINILHHIFTDTAPHLHVKMWCSMLHLYKHTGAVGVNLYMYCTTSLHVLHHIFTNILHHMQYCTTCLHLHVHHMQYVGYVI